MPEPSDIPTEDELRDLTALADGRLPRRRAAALEPRIAESPALRRALERQRHAVAALAAVDVSAPAGLRARLAAAEPARERGGRSWFGWAVAGATALAVAAVAIVLSLGGASAPTVDQAAGLASRGPAGPAPAVDPGQPTLLAAHAEGLAYPNWKREFGWGASGRRADRISGRDATTVFYDNADGNRIAYTIVSGDPLETDPGAEPERVDGIELAVGRDGDRTVVTWLRDGHTCVLSGAGVDRRTMLELAAWKGDGAVAF